MDLHHTRSLGKLLSIAIATVALIGPAPAFADRDRHDRHDHHDRHAPAPRVVVHHPVGHVVTVLPPEHRVVRVGRADYYYRDGVFYQPAVGGYAVVAAPVGAFITTLPVGHAKLIRRGRTYYLHNDTYFSWDAKRGGYIVVARP